MSPSKDIFDVSYTHYAGSSQSAARGARYITRRPEDRGETEPTRESDWREIEHTGDKDRFIAEANRRRDEKRERSEERGTDPTRDKSPGAAAYVHVVISPENGGREMSDEDFQRVAERFIRDESGREYPYVGAVHRDGGHEHDHMHLLIARDKISRAELEESKEHCREVIRNIERERGIDRAPERERESAREYEPQRESDREPERTPRPEPQLERSAVLERDTVRDRDEGREIER